MSWTVTRESGAVAFADGLGEEAKAVSAEQRALAEAFRSHPPISLKLSLRGQPDPFETTGLDPAAPAGLAQFLGHARAVYEELFDRLPMMIQLIDANGAVASVNRASFEMLGYEPEEIVGSQAMSLFSEETRRKLTASVLPRFHETGRITNVAVELLGKSGETVEARMTAVGDSIGAGRIGRSIALFEATGSGS